MSPDRMRWAAWIGAAALAVVAAVMTLDTLGNREAPGRRISRRATDLRELQALRRVAARRDAELARMRQAGMDVETNEVTLAGLAQASLGAAPASLKELDAPEVPPAWLVRRVRLSLKDVNGEAFGEFLAVLASNRPPWTVAECALKASTRPGWLATAELTLEQARPAKGPAVQK